MSETEFSRAAREAISRWEAQQQHYAAHRLRRWAAVVDAVMEMLGPDPAEADVVVDLGCGPGALTAQLRQRTRATVWGVEADGFLLALAAETWPDVHWHEGSFLESGGSWAAPVPGDGYAAIVSNTTLHYLSADELVRLYRAAAGVLRPGGVILTADQLPRDGEQPSSAPAGPWRDWWDAVAACPVLGPVLRRYPRQGLPHGDHHLTVAEHLACARAAGLDGGEIWREGASAVLLLRSRCR